jgi:hypothetical protein
MVGITAFPARSPHRRPGLAAVAQVVLRQPFTDSIDGRQRGIRQDGKMGLNHGELLLYPFRVATSGSQHNGDIGPLFFLKLPFYI